MSLHSPAVSSPASPGSHTALPAADPVRDPASATATERTRRSAILLLLTLLVPGGAQVVAGSRGLGRVALRVTLAVWATLLVGGVLLLTARGFLLGVLAQPAVQVVGVVVLLALAAGWLLLWLDTLRLVRPSLLAPGARKATVLATVVALLVTSGGLTYGAYVLNAGRGALGSIFGTGPDLQASEGRYNFLIMGGDAGEGRSGLRPDSIHVASVDADSGATSLFSIPRNLQNAPFTEDSPLWQAYPDGFSCGDECIINALYVDVTNNHASLYPDAADPGAEAMMDAVGGILGLDVDGYVLVDMDGFSELIDAMGGVTVTTGGWVTHRGRRPDGQWGNIWWEPGTHRFDGEDALAYARSRKFSNDYSRIRRQQCMQQAMLRQFTPATVLTRFQGILDAGEQIVETNMPQSQLGEFVDLADKAQARPMERLTIGPPDFGEAGERFTTFPDFELIHSRVDAVLEEQAQAAPAAGFSALPLLTVAAPLSESPEVDEDDPSTWPEAPTMVGGQEITPELLMQLDDAGDEASLTYVSSTKELCAPGR